MTHLAPIPVKPTQAHGTRYRNSELTVQRHRHEHAGETPFGPFPADDAFVAVLQVGELPPFNYWVDGKQHMQRGGLPGALNVFDLQSGPSCVIDGPVDNLHLHIPRRALDDFADEVDAPRIDRLYMAEGWETVDPVAGGLVQTIAALYDRDSNTAANQLVTDHAVLALYTHLVTAYGGVRIAGRRHSGGLAPWQERAAKELMVANIERKLSLAEVAQVTGLSVAHFARAFKNSTSVAPHAWLQNQRIEKAKILLQDRERSLAEIGLASGFADQSHFTRVFSKATGTTPGSWRRCRA